MQAPPQRGALTVAEAARYVGIHPKTIRAWIANPALHFPVAQPGGRRGRLLIPVRALDTWLDTQAKKRDARA